MTLCVFTTTLPGFGRGSVGTMYFSEYYIPCSLELQHEHAMFHRVVPNLDLKCWLFLLGAIMY